MNRAQYIRYTRTRAEWKMGQYGRQKLREILASANSSAAIPSANTVRRWMGLPEIDPVAPFMTIKEIDNGD